MSRVDITSNRIVRTNAEGYRADVYDDSDGLPIVCTGQPTVGYGCRVRAWSKEFALAVMQLQLQSQFDAPLSSRGWYVALDDIRGSVVLEAAFNLGVDGLLHGFPKFVDAMTLGDIQAASDELHVSDSRIDSGRYQRLREILRTGIDA